ncbi:MAG TPA: hypothetical protein VE077_01660 [Candidatus Methylomirabilis sp.]|nr:hypothetical protein [Candidatus Methylomirabilis sp.]
MMKHLNEEELIAYCEGETVQREAISAHVAECGKCREELERIQAVLAALDALPIPNPGEDYGQRVWQRIAPRLPEKRARWRDFFLGSRGTPGWLEPRRWVAVGSVGVLVIAAFVAGRLTRRPPSAAANVAEAAQVRERVLIMAVGEHLGRSEMVLVELSNAQPRNPAQKQVNIAAEQRRAENLLEENRLYRQTALQEGDAALANTLDELERVLLDVANGPEQVTPAQLETLRKRIEARGILFKVRVVSKELRERQKSTAKTPAQKDSAKKEGNKI